VSHNRGGCGSSRFFSDNVIQRLRDALEAHNKHSQKAALKLSFGIATGEKGCVLSDVLKKAEAVLG
jgi:PleD family two-component response regulator